MIDPATLLLALAYFALVGACLVVARRGGTWAEPAGWLALGLTVGAAGLVLGRMGRSEQGEGGALPPVPEAEAEALDQRAAATDEAIEELTEEIDEVTHAPDDRDAAGVAADSPFARRLRRLRDEPGDGADLP